MKKKLPLISVIVPVYNTEHYVRDCILSIVKQNYDNLEIVIVDDGSTDSSPQIMQDLEREYQEILHVYHIDNSGVSAARNFGIEHSHGKYIFFVDADDYLDKDCISYYYKLIHRSQADVSIVPQPNKFHELSSENTKVAYNYSTKCVSGKDATREMLYYKIVISSWGKLFSRELIDKFQIRFNERLAYGEGFLFTIQCLYRAKKVAMGYKPVYNYRLSNSNSAMTNYKERLVEDSIASQKLIQKELANDEKDFQPALNYAYWHTCFDCLNTIVGAKASKTNLDTFKMLHKEVQRKAIVGLNSPISKGEKLKSALYLIAPTTAARIVNLLRKRKFTTTSEDR